MTAKKWSIDINQSDVLIRARHSIIAYLAGKANEFKGTITVKDDELQDASIDFIIDVNTKEGKLENIDTYLKLNYTSNKWQFALVPHYFNAPSVVLDTDGSKMNAYLGTEIDFTTTYTVQKDIVASAGYSQMFGSSTLERVKNITNAAQTNNWVWVMVSFSPRIFTLK